MKIHFSCNKCLADPQGIYVPSWLHIQNEGVYKHSCINGHQTVTILQNQKFEILFEAACSALHDGYLREAIASFAAAIERFHELCIKIFLQKSDIIPEHFKKLWAAVSSQSERQLGAFLFLYSQTTKQLPSNFILDNNGWSKFRNSVIHKGYFPTVDETMEWGEKVFNYIKEIISILKKELKEAVDKTLFQEAVELQKKHSKNSVMDVGTQVNFTNATLSAAFSEVLKNIKEKKQRGLIG